MARGRRSDHTREQLLDLILVEGSRLMEEVGSSAFSARELGRRIGYSVSTVLKTMGDNDRLLMAINTRTFSLWADQVERSLKDRTDGRLEILVRAYFDFAARNPRLWMAIYDHHLPAGATIPDEQQEVRGRLVEAIVREVAGALPASRRDRAPKLARSLIATVHGHCHMWLAGSMELMGETDPLGQAVDRVMDSIRQATS